MTIKEIIYNLRGLVRDAKSDDIDLSDRQYEFIINYLREKLIVQQLQKKRSISANITQDLGQLELELVDAGEGERLTNKHILRTIRELPQPVESDQKDLFTYIGGLDKNSPIPYKSQVRVSWKKYTKYASKIPTAYYSDQRMYVHGAEYLRYVSIEGVFLNPREAFNFVNPDVDFDNQRYPISGRLLDQLNSLFKNQELSILLQLVEDNTNDATPN